MRHWISWADDTETERRASHSKRAGADTSHADSAEQKENRTAQNESTHGNCSHAMRLDCDVTFVASAPRLPVQSHLTIPRVETTAPWTLDFFEVAFTALAHLKAPRTTTVAGSRVMAHAFLP